MVPSEESQTTGGDDASRAATIALCGFAVVAGALLRVAAMGGDLSFDEVWSIAWARWADSPLDVFTRMHIDNNHYLNTLTMRMLLPLDWHDAYRIPSVVASIVSIVLAAIYGIRHSRAAAIGCAVLHAFSFLLIQYGTEARGYALALALVVGGMLVFERAPEESGRRLLAFSCIVVAGVLAHLSFMLFAIPASTILLFRIAKRSTKPGTKAARLASLVAVPAIVTGSLWWFDLRFLRIAGGPKSSMLAAIEQLAALVFGVWRGPFVGVAALAACALLFLFLVPRVRAQQRDLMLIALGSMLIGLAVVPGNMAYARYFLVPFELALLALGCGLGALSSRSDRRVGVLCIVVVAISNLPAVIELAIVGRGHYRRALATIVERSPSGVIPIGSDHDLRNGELMRFYAPMIPGGERILYRRSALKAGEPAEWLVFHDTEADVPASPELIEVRGARYALAWSEPHAGMSGFSWHVYRRVSAAR